MIATAAGIVCVLIWLYLLVARGGFWQVKKHLPPALAERQSSCRVAVIIPARNEATVVGRSLSSLFRQMGGHSIGIFLVDDGSSDGTAEIARQAAAESSASGSLTIIQGSPLPHGWTGKLWAMQQGIERAREWRPDYFLLTDADILHAPHNIAMLVSIAESSGYDLASFMVKLQCATVPEKFLIPAFVFFFFKLYPPAWTSDRRHRTAGAAGGSILIRPNALAHAGGIAAIRSEIIDDCALARTVKAHAGKLWLGLTPATVSLRSYKTFSELGRMISRTAFNQLHHSVLLLLMALIGLTIMYLLPLYLVFTHRPLAAVLGGFAWLLMATAYLPMVRFYDLNPLWALTLPLSALFYMGATLYSAVRYWSGHGGEWKGRTQDRSP